MYNDNWQGIKFRRNKQTLKHFPKMFFIRLYLILRIMMFCHLRLFISLQKKKLTLLKMSHEKVLSHKLNTK
jgi:hypothetical protein